MEDFIIFVVLLIIIGGAVIYLIKAKKRGVKCIGCPAARECSQKNDSLSGCGCACAGEAKKHKGGSCTDKANDREGNCGYHADKTNN